MSYLGRGLEQVDNISKLDNITFNGGTTYALTKDSAAFTPISSNALLVSIDGVIQQGNFSVSGTNIVFNFSPTGSNTCDFIMHYGTGVAFTPADSSVTKDKANFISTSSAAGLQIKGDGTTDGTLQLNCSQNSHGVKIKSPAHSAGQSYTLTLPTTSPSADKFLKTDGTGNLSFADAGGGGGMTLVGQSVDTASGGTTYNGISFDDVFSATYDNYLIVASFTTETDGDNVRMRFREGSSDLTGSSYIYSFREHNINTSNSGSFSSSGVSGQSYIDITSSQTNHISNHATLYGYVFLPFVNDARTQFLFHVNGYTDGNSIKNRNTAAKYNAAHNTADGFTLYAESGSLDEHSIQIFGIHKS